MQQYVEKDKTAHSDHAKQFEDRPSAALQGCLWAVFFEDGF